MAFDLVLFGGTGDLTWRKLMPALFQAWRHGKLPEGGRILAVSRQDLTRRRLPRLAQGPLRRSRRRQAPERRRVRSLRRPAPLPAPRSLAAGDYARLKDWLASPVGRAAPADVVVMYLATSPRSVPGRLRPARRGRPERAERTRRPREAARPRPGERAADQPRRPLGVRRGAGIPHRPLPRQAGGAEPDGAALRQRPVRAALAARVHRQHPDHARRIDRRRHARRLLQPHRRAARHDPEPRAAAADDGHDGAAVANGRRRDPRREAEGAALAQAVRRRQRRPRRRARPVPRRQRRRQGGAGLPRGRQGAAGEHDRDLRRAAHRSAELALGRRAVLPAHRQAPRRARRADRRQLQAHAAHRSFRAATRPTSWSSSCSPKTASSCTCSPPRARARPRRSRRSRSTSTSTRRSPPNRVGAYERLLLDVIAGRLNLFVRSDEQEEAWRWVEPILEEWRRDDAAPRPYTAGTWGPAAASALVARDGFAWAEEQ